MRTKSRKGGAARGSVLHLAAYCLLATLFSLNIGLHLFGNGHRRRRREVVEASISTGVVDSAGFPPSLGSAEHSLSEVADAVQRYGGTC